MLARLTVLLAFAAIASAQTADNLSPSIESAAPSPGAELGKDKPSTTGDRSLSSELPKLDPTSEVVTWDGQSWSLHNNRLSRARFEKFLNAAEETDSESSSYRKIMESIMEKLAPGRVSSRSVDEAWELLPQASNYAIDAHLSDALADAIYAITLARREQERLKRFDEALERQRRTHEWNRRMAATPGLNDEPPRTKEAVAIEAWEKRIATERTLRQEPHEARLVDIVAKIKANELKREVNELKTKVEFQALAVQLFFQRRFQHVLIANRFYRALFGDGDTELRVNEDLKAALTKGSGLPATLGVLDSLANESIRDVKEAVEAFRFLLSKEELASGTERLGEAFAIGEFLPVIRLLPRDDKRLSLQFMQQCNQLLSAIDVKDFRTAEELLAKIESQAKDFDDSKPRAAIETAKTVSAMHLSKARLAAISGDRKTLEEELRRAMEIWPRNPDLAKVSGVIFSQTDIQQQALTDLDRLIEQKNFRLIFQDKVRFIAASALYPEKQEQLREILEDMQNIEGAILRAKEVAKRGDYSGAWESLERAHDSYPDDPVLNQERAEFTTKAADFVRALRRAQQFEEKGQTAASLTWFLRARRIYPGSEFAVEAIERLVPEVMGTN